MIIMPVEKQKLPQVGRVSQSGPESHPGDAPDCPSDSGDGEGDYDFDKSGLSCETWSEGGCDTKYDPRTESEGAGKPRERE